MIRVGPRASFLVLFAVAVLASGCGGDGDGDIGAFCDVAREQRESLVSSAPVEVIAAAQELVRAAPDELRPAVQTYLSALEAEAAAPTGNGEVDAAAVAEAMEAIEQGRGVAAPTLMEVLRDECGISDLDL